MAHEAWWRLALAAGFLLFLAGVGVYTTLRPDWCMTSLWFWRQGEMKRTMQRDGVRAVGVVFSVVSLWMLFELLSSVSG
jgi:hypothetical protein